MAMHSFELVAAYLLDLIVGDPYRFPHPVKITGKGIQFLEKWMRGIISTKKGEMMGGIVMAISIPASAYLISDIFIKATEKIVFFNYIVIIYFAYTTLAVRSLKVEADKVYNSLRSRDILRARMNLSAIVGRETKDLNKNEIIKATVETVAENTSDGIIAPLFYLIIGGVPLAFAYKAINTLDSMIGYKTEEYLYFGRASARMDDMLNYIPARLTGLLIVIASFFNRMDWIMSYKIMIRDGKKHDSPNSGIPEAAMAGSLGIQLGGNRVYSGEEKIIHLIGENKNGTGDSHIKEALIITYTVSSLMIIMGAAVLW